MPDKCCFEGARRYGACLGDRILHRRVQERLPAGLDDDTTIVLAINLPGSSPLSPDRWRDGGLSAGVMAIVRTVVETKSRRQLISIGAAIWR